MRVSKTVIIAASQFVMASAMFAQSAAPDSLAQIRSALTSLYLATVSYYNDAGKWPASIHDLEDKSYIEIDSAITKAWTFKMEVGPRLFTATSVATYKVVDCGEWSDAHSHMSYDVLSGRTTGTGIPRYEQDTLTADEQAELTKDARNTLRAIWSGAQVYYSDRGEWPETVEQLDAERYIGISLGSTEPDLSFDMVVPSVFSQWQFALIGEPPVRAVAISTKELPTGAGRWIEFDGSTNTFQGYGTQGRSDSIQSPVKRIQYFKKQR